MVPRPQKGYIERMKIYFNEMFPITERFLQAILLYVSFTFALSRIYSVSVQLDLKFTFVGIWSVFMLMLILRLMDELKDKDIDRELFPGRPLPSGKVRDSDITFTLGVAIVLYLIPNLLVGKAFFMALFVLGYALLMLKYFFIARILRRYLLLNLATHNPIIPFMLLYLTLLFAMAHGVDFGQATGSSSLLLTLMYWAPFFAWEISRKIRASEDENAYVTYSQILGRGGAVAVVGTAQTIAFGISVYFFHTLGLSKVFLLILLTGYSVTVWGLLRFLFHSTPITSNLKPFAELFILSIFLAQIVENAVPPAILNHRITFILTVIFLILILMTVLSRKKNSGLIKKNVSLQSKL